VWQWSSTDDDVNPDAVLVRIGDNPTLEAMAAAHILRSEIPELRVHVVNVTDLMVLEKDSGHPHGLDVEMFEALFTPDRPVNVNFHSYPSAVKQLLFGRANIQRFQTNGYREEGTTTTPIDMAVRNGTSRFHLIMQAIRLAAAHNARVAGHRARASLRVGGCRSSAFHSGKRSGPGRNYQLAMVLNHPHQTIRRDAWRGTDTLLRSAAQMLFGNC